MWYKKLFKSNIECLDKYNLPKREKCSSEILLSVYNAKDVIKCCLESVLPQLNEEIKLVILDDFSSDKGTLLIEELIKKYKKNVTFIKNKENLGLSFNLFRLVNSSNAEYCFRMDIDDIALKDRFSIQLEFMKNNQLIDILGTQVDYLDKYNNIIGKSKKPLSNNNIISSLYSNPMIHPTVVFRKKKILNVGNYSPHYRYGQDYELWMRSAFFNLKFANLPVSLLKYRISQVKKYNIKTLFYELLVGLYWIPKLKFSLYQYLMILGRFFYRSIIYILSKNKK